jgi:hypothetical protein
MSMQEDDKWLDELISKSVDTTKPEFDAEKWKRQHPEALRSLLSRRARPALPDNSGVLRRIFARPAVGLGAAAAVIIVVSALLFMRNRRTPNESVSEPRPVTQSPAKLVSMISLRAAYQRGGWDALDRQFRETLDTLGPGPSTLSVQQLLEGSKAF